jgi:hypothetical protein
MSHYPDLVNAFQTSHMPKSLTVPLRTANHLPSYFNGIAALLLAFQVWQVYKTGPGQGIDPFLKRLALTALGISLLVGGLG